MDHNTESAHRATAPAVAPRDLDPDVRAWQLLELRRRLPDLMLHTLEAGDEAARRRAEAELDRVQQEIAHLGRCLDEARR